MYDDLGPMGDDGSFDPEMAALDDGGFGGGYLPGAGPSDPELAQFGADFTSEDFQNVMGGVGTGVGSFMELISGFAKLDPDSPAAQNAQGSALQVQALEAQIQQLLDLGNVEQAAVLQNQQQLQIAQMQADLAAVTAASQPKWYTHPAAIIGFTVLGVGTVYVVARMAMGQRAYDPYRTAPGW